MAERELTFGEKAVGLTFNPSSDPNVSRCKKLFAELIDGLHEGREQALEKMRRKEPGAEDHYRLFSIAITEAQGAQMWAVKALTWKEG